MILKFAIFFGISISTVLAGDEIVDAKVGGMEKIEPISGSPGKSPEDSIPVIEIRGEGKPMTAAQIRALEEETTGKPMDITVKYTWQPRDCKHKAKRMDFVTFHYKCFLENGKKIDQTYGREPIRIQLGVGQTMPGLDKGLRGICDSELRKIQIPWRLSRKKKSRVWKFIPNEEHWLTFDIEMLKVEPWTPELQFNFMETTNDSLLTVNELVKHVEKVRKDYGKGLPNEDIDVVLLCKYFVQYFDRDGDNRVSVQEYSQIMKEDLEKMRRLGKIKVQGRRRDPGIAWVLDFNGDGQMSRDELNMAPELLEGGQVAIQKFLDSLQSKKHDEL